MSTHNNAHEEAEGQHQPSPSSDHPSTGTSRGQGALAELLAFNTPLGSLYNHPLECGRIFGKSAQQVFSRLAGTAFRPERDIGVQTGKVVLVTGGKLPKLSVIIYIFIF